MDNGRIRRIDTDLKEVGLVLGITLIVFSTLIGFPTVVQWAEAGAPPAVPSGITIVQNLTTDAFIDWNDSGGATNYLVYRQDNYLFGEEVNANATWSYREQQVNVDPFDPLCGFADIGIDADGFVEMSGDSGFSNNMSECYMFKMFPRDFLNGTKIQMNYEFSNIQGSNTLSTFVDTRNEPNQLQRNDESEWAELTARNFASTDVVIVNTENLLVNEGRKTIDLVTTEGQWNSVDTDYASIILELRDASTLGQDGTVKVFWINITDFDTGAPRGFYNFSAGTETGEPEICADGQDCKRGFFNAGTTIINNDFRLIGIPTISQLLDTTMPTQQEVTYKIQSESGQGKSSNSTGVDFGLIQRINNLGATAMGASQIDLEWDLVTTVHPTDVLTGVEIKREQSINGTWQWFERDDVAGGGVPNCNANDGTDFVQLSNLGSAKQDGCSMFMNFNSDDLDNLGVTDVKVAWSGVYNGGFTLEDGDGRVGWQSTSVEQVAELLEGTGAMSGGSGNFVNGFSSGDETHVTEFDTFTRTAPTNTIQQMFIALDDTTILTNDPELRIYNITLLAGSETVAFWEFDSSSLTNFGGFGTFEASSFSVGGIDGGLGVFSLVGTVDELETTFSDTGLNSETQYTYQVNGISAVSNGTTSASASATTTIDALGSTMNLALIHDNVNFEIDLDWDDVVGADNYTVQRLSTERIIEDNNSLQGDNNFGSGGNAVGDFSSIAEGEIAVQVSLKTGRFGSNIPSGGVHFSGYWTNVIIGVADINNINPTSRSEVEQTGFMVSAGTRLSRDCLAGGTGDPLTSNAFISPREQDGYTQNSVGEWIDYGCIVQARFLGNQLHNLTASEAVNSEITAVSRVNTTSGGFSVIREGVGTGIVLSNKVTGLWQSTVEIETGTWKLNSTFIDLATTLTSDFTDTTTNNYNSYFYRIIANNEGGGGQASDIVNGTLSVRPNRVNDLNGTDNGSTVDLNWEEATIKFSRIGVSNDPVQGYIIQRAPANETTLYDGLIHDVEEFFIKNDGGVTIATGQGSGSGGAPSYGSDVSFGGQMLNITTPVNVTRMVVKIGVNDGNGFNAEPDIAGAIYFENGTAVARTIFPRIANQADMEKWSATNEDQENFVNWAFSPPVQLQPAEYMFGWDSLNTQMCNSASCGLGNADVGDMEVFFENTGYQQGSAGFAVGHIQSSGASSYNNPINNSKVNDYAMAIYVEPVWTTIGTNLGVSNTTFTDNSPPIGVTKAYRILAFNDAGISHPPTLLHNPQGTLLGKMGNSTDFFPKDSQGRNRAGGLIVGEVLTFEVTTPPVPTAITDLVVSVVGEQCNLSWTVPSGSITGHRILRAVDGGSFVELTANSGTSGLHSDLGLVIGSLYQYDVRALNAQGQALSSNLESCTPVASGVAPAPTGLTASNLPNGDVQLMWDNPNNPSISGYQIERKLENGAFIIIDPDTGSSGVSFTDSTTVLGNEYTYRIASINTFGFSDTSNEANIMTLNPPNMPTLSAEQVGTMITLTFTEPTSDGTINGYKIEKRTNFGSFSVLVANTTTTLLTFDDSAVTKPNTYGYRVSAHDDIPSTSTVSNVVDVIFGSHLTVFVKEQDLSGFKGGGFVTVFNTTAGGGGGSSHLNGIDNSTAPNSGTLGSGFDGKYFEPVTNTTSKDFTVVTGAINEGVFQDGSVDGLTTAEIRFGDDSNKASWNFLHQANTGFNITSINLWLNGDVVGGADYPILDTQSTDIGSTGESDGFSLFTANGETWINIYNDQGGEIIQDNVLDIAPDDGQWHMITVVYDKGNITASSNVFGFICIDATCLDVEDSQAFGQTASNDANSTLTVGSRHDPFGNIVENMFDVDDITVWQDHQLTQSNIDAMYNSGSGASAGATGLSIELAKQVGHWNFDLQSGGGGGGGGAIDFSQTLPLDSTSKVIFDNLDAGTYNYTFIDNDNFVLNKTFNNVFPSGTSSDSFSISALVFDVDCPNTSGTDVRIKLNYTDLQSISSYPATPVCDNADKISWATTWTGDTGTQQSQFIADFISPRFRANADNFLVGLIPVSTSYSQNLNRIISSTFDISTASDVTINFDIFLGDAPAGGGDPSPSGGSSGSGSTSIPSQKIVFTNRLQGLTLLSISHMFIQPSDVIKGTITVGWQGEQDMVIRKISVDEFTDIIRFADRAPFDLDPVVEGAGETARSEAEIDYTIFIPDVFCDAELGITLNCFPPELVVIPVEFTFEFEGQDFIGSTEIVLDARPIPIPFAQLQTIALFIGILFSALVANSIRKGISKKGKKQKKIRNRLKG